MRAAILAFALLTAPAFAGEPLPSGGELMELRYACFGEDANEFTGDRAATNDACRQWDEIEAKAKQSGLCLDDGNNDLAWKPCA